jgi:hypothetical protein
MEVSWDRHENYAAGAYAGGFEFTMLSEARRALSHKLYHQGPMDRAAIPVAAPIVCLTQASL